MSTFKAMLATETDGKFTVSCKDLPANSLPDEEVLVQVAYSSLNYKDGLALNGNLGKVMRKLPMIPGIDLSGTVLESSVDRYKKGDEVLLTGNGIGETSWGGYAQLAKVKADWLIDVPEGISLSRAMAIGTAGFTAMLGVMALEDAGVTRGDKSVLVTGAGGGVGSIAVAILARLGYSVAASTGRMEAKNYFEELGASELVARDKLSRPSKPIESGTWAGAIDTVGSQTLATALAQIVPHGAIAVCGNAGGNDLPTTVLPLILRGVSLLGIDSVHCPIDRRREAWQRLATDLPISKLDSMTNIVSFANLLEESKKILKGNILGRTVITLD